jgi:hypothetical protein
MTNQCGILFPVDPREAECTLVDPVGLPSPPASLIGLAPLTRYGTEARENGGKNSRTTGREMAGQAFGVGLRQLAWNFGRLGVSGGNDWTDYASPSIPFRLGASWVVDVTAGSRGSKVTAPIFRIFTRAFLSDHCSMMLLRDKLRLD